MTEAFVFAPDRTLPNSRLPLVVIRGPLALDPDDPAATFEKLFAGNGWTRAWRNGIYPYCHYHSTAHEVLGVAKGSASVRFGGERGRVLDVVAGDVVVIPAGVAHQLVSEHDLLVVGAYEGGRAWDIVRAREGPSAEGGQEAALGRIAAVPLPERDPVAGADGEVLRLWASA